ncbi:MAG: RIP metalloprotease RseP [Saprospiraceae bacterium]|nr:RIP metalloprotease RseP [Saprospiraceae bacterium]
MDTLINVSQFLLSLSLLIVLHEMGHFLPARWFKTRVEKFYLFFDFAPFNALWKTRRGETEYGIGWLPLGGYVKIAGMVDESMDTEALKQPPQPWEFRSKPAWQRLIIMLGGVTVNFLLGFFIFGMMLWVYGEEYTPTRSAKDGLAFDSLMLNQGFRDGDLIVRVGDKPFDRIDEGAFLESLILDEAGAVTVRRNGTDTVLRLSGETAQSLAKSGRMRTALFTPRMPFYVESVAAGKPAEKAGLLAGDRIISLNESPTPFYDQFVRLAQTFKGQSVTLGIQRSADTLSLPLTLTAEGQIGVYARQKGLFEVERKTYSLAEALPGGVQRGMAFLNTQIKAFGMMITAKLNPNENLGSLISISKLYGTTWNWERFWGLTASLSILLAFMNLLPIPALDGGYVVFLLWEVFTGRKVSDSVMEKAVTVGFFLLLALMIYAFGLDLWRHVFQQFF